MPTYPARLAPKQHPRVRADRGAAVTSCPQLRGSIARRVRREKKTFRRHPETTAQQPAAQPSPSRESRLKSPPTAAMELREHPARTLAHSPAMPELRAARLRSMARRGRRQASQECRAKAAPPVRREKRKPHSAKAMTEKL